MFSPRYRKLARPSPALRRQARPRVEALEDRWLPSTFFVSNTNDSGSGSLRQAILDANANAGQDTISFVNLPTGVQVIQPQTALPAITDSVILDGTTKSDYTGTPRVVIDGILLGMGGTGLEVSAGNTTIRGLDIQRFQGSGILIDSGATTNTIASNYIGIDTDGLTARPNGVGVNVTTSSNTIGGLTTSARNIISGNSQHGILIAGSSNLVENNYIGTDSTGAVKVANQLDGIRITGGVTGSQIGGTLAAARNVISGNNEDGVRIVSVGTSSNVIEGNFIGTSAAGRTALGNGEDGIRLTNGAAANTIGGLVTGARNVISANNEHGIFITLGSVTNVVQGNFIGTDVTGVVGLGNKQSGVRIDSASQSNTIGGTLPAARNIISGNSRDGITIFGTNTNNNVVERNSIGVNSRGAALANTFYGIAIGNGAQNNQIGEALTGKVLGIGNTIEFNGKAGVGVADNNTTGNSIRGNAIFGNLMLGIDLNDDGVTLNHTGGPIPGPNNFQNFPVITSVTQVVGGTQVQGTLNSAANTTYTIDFYSSPSADASGYGQGQKYAGSTVVTTDANGNASFTVVLKPAIANGRALSATATDPGGNTSEFAQDVTVGASVTAGANATLTAVLLGGGEGRTGLAITSPHSAATPTANSGIVGAVQKTSDGYLFAIHHLAPAASEDAIGLDALFASL